MSDLEAPSREGRRFEVGESRNENLILAKAEHSSTKVAKQQSGDAELRRGKVCLCATTAKGENRREKAKPGREAMSDLA